MPGNSFSRRWNVSITFFSYGWPSVKSLISLSYQYLTVLTCHTQACQGLTRHSSHSDFDQFSSLKSSAPWCLVWCLTSLSFILTKISWTLNFKCYRLVLALVSPPLVPQWESSWWLTSSGYKAELRGQGWTARQTQRSRLPFALHTERITSRPATDSYRTGHKTWMTLETRNTHEERKKNLKPKRGLKLRTLTKLVWRVLFLYVGWDSVCEVISLSA